MNNQKPKMKNVSQYDLGMVMVMALENKFYRVVKDLGNSTNPSFDYETSMGNINKSPLLEKLFKKAFKSRYYFSGIKTNHDTSMHIAVLINQKEFESIVKTIAPALRIEGNILGLLGKTVKYKGRFYLIRLLQGNLVMPDTSKEKHQIEKKLRQKWRKQIKEEQKSKIQNNS